MRKFVERKAGFGSRHPLIGLMITTRQSVRWSWVVNDHELALARGPAPVVARKPKPKAVPM